MSIRHATHDDLPGLVAVAVDAQADPDRACAYLGDDAASIAADVKDISGTDGGDWATTTWVAADVDGALHGWLLADADPEMSRVWWWGPLLASTAGPNGLDVASRLFETAEASLSDYREHELALDSRSVSLPTFAERQRFAPDAASAVLTTPPFGDELSTPDPGVIPIDERHRASVALLHDELFAGTHTPGAKIVDADADHIRLVVEDPDGDTVAGYVATERQSDDSLYVDYLGVRADQRGRGIGRRLVAEAMRQGASSGTTHAHLTVRTANEAARRLYRSLGFVEERILVPYRRGFALD